MPNPTDTTRALVQRFERAIIAEEQPVVSWQAADATQAEVRDARAALLAHVAGLTEALSDAAEALERVRGESQHCDCYAFDVAQIVLNKHSGFAFATRPTEARDA